MMAGYPPYYVVYLKQLLHQKCYRSLLADSYKSRDILGRFVWDKFLKLLRFKQEIGAGPLLNPEFRRGFALALTVKPVQMPPRAISRWSKCSP